MTKRKPPLLPQSNWSLPGKPRSGRASEGSFFSAGSSRRLSAPQGRSEATFEHYLRQNFGSEHIFTACRVRVGSSWYYPDIIYSDAAGLRIDIEIDEPYVWATGKPHHYLGQDDARNAFFLQQQWLVLRFTEEQVVRYPMCCCQLLADLIFHVTGQHYAPRSYRERLTPQPQWDWEEAKRLAAVESRKSYEANFVYYGEEEFY